MDVCAARDTLIPQDLRSPCEYSSAGDSGCNALGDLSMNDLGNCLTEFLKIEDFERSACSLNSSHGEKGVGRPEKKDGDVDAQLSESGKFVVEKQLAKATTFPPAGQHSLPVSEILLDGNQKLVNNITAEVTSQDGCATSACQSYTRSISLPTPLKPVSALKGSREKQGLPPKKLSVTWAPDVYDPPPTAVSHVASNKSQRHNKRYGKNKQKNGGKSSRGNRGKDKKQVRKNSGGSSSNRVTKPLDDNRGITGFNELEASVVDFDVGNPDPFCGTSFLRKSVTNLHFPVAEAT